jgi:hypothetical protein
MHAKYTTEKRRALIAFNDFRMKAADSYNELETTREKLEYHEYMDRHI